MWKYPLLVIFLVIVLAYYWSIAIYCDLEKLEVRYDETRIVGVPRLSIPQTAKMPFVQYPKANSKKLYTVMLLDPDAPNTRKPADHPWRHWLVIDIPGHKLKSGSANLEGIGVTISPYIGPKPPVGSGRHCYRVQVYEQEGKLTGAEADVDNTRRQNWPEDQFAAKHNLYMMEQRTFTIRA